MENRKAASEQGAFAFLQQNRIRMIYITSAKYSSDWASRMHAHGFSELFYVVGGAGRLQFAGGILPVERGDMVLVNPHVDHTEYSAGDLPLEYIVLGVAGLDFLPEAEDGPIHYLSVHLADRYEEIMFCLHSMLRENLEKQEGYEAICQRLLEILLVHLMRSARFSTCASQEKAAQSSGCAAVRRYIDLHFKEAVSLDRLAQIGHMNKYYMGHAFAREYGISPIQYLLECRIAASCQLLSQTDHSLSDIAGMIGFCSSGSFSQAFRKRRGLSPLEYRKKTRGPD